MRRVTAASAGLAIIMACGCEPAAPVAERQPPPSKAVVTRTADGAQIEGLANAYWGGATDRQNSVNAVLSVALTAMGQDIGYDWLMGTSGAAFRLQVMQPNWCPSAACSVPGFDCVATAVEASGAAITWLDTPKGQTRMSEATRRALVASIDAGRPVLRLSEECSVMTGYRVATQPDEKTGRRVGDLIMLVRPYSARKDGYVPTTKLPWTFGVITPGEPIRGRKAAIGSVRLALRLARVRQAGDYAVGLNAWNLWIEQLGEEQRFASADKKRAFATALGNAYVFTCLVDARLAAVRYLRSVADEFSPAAARHIRRAADYYDELQLKLCQKRSLAPYPWEITPDKPWTAAMRAEQAKALREALIFEQSALDELKSALEAEGVWSAAGR